MDGGTESEQSQFVPQSGDEENLWEILGIIAEKGNKYKVKWAGVDPKTEKPWGNSWVKKSDVTPDVVQEWKEKQARKLRRKSSTKTLSKAGSKKSRASTERPDSTSTTTLRRGRSSIASTSRQARSPSASQTPPPPASVSASPPKTTGKRKLGVITSPNASSDFEFPDILTVLQGVREGSEPQKKKRKVSGEIEVFQPRASTSALKVASSSKSTRLEGAQDTQEGKHIGADHEEDYEDAEHEEGRRPAKRTEPEPSKPRSKSRGKFNELASRHPKAKVLFNGTAAGVSKTKAKGKGRAEPNVNGRVKKSAPVVLSDDAEDEDDDEGLEVMNQLTQNGKLSESDEDDRERELVIEEPKAKSKFKPSAVAPTEPSIPPRTSKHAPSRTSKKLADPEGDEAELTDDVDNVARKASHTALPEGGSPNPDVSLTPWTIQRLGEFDESMRRLDEEVTTESERPAAVPYGESDVDSTAVDIMYPPVEGGLAPSKRKGQNKSKALERQPTLSNDIPELLLRPPSSPPPESSRPIPGTPRSSLKSKMKPRTPRSGAGSLVSFADLPEPPPPEDLDLAPIKPLPIKPVNGKVNGVSKSITKPKLGPIPQISPSKFYPHLPTSSLLDTTIEDAEPEPDEPMSSIEQFESPEKPAHVRVAPAIPSKRKDKGKGKEQLEEVSLVENDLFWGADIVLDVERMREREAQKEADRRREAQPPASKRRSLEDVIQQHVATKNGRDRTPNIPSSPANSLPPPQPHETLDDDDDDDDFYIDEPTDYHETQTAEEGAPPAPPQHLPEEEEESTQDLLHELEVQKAVGRNDASLSPPPEPEPEPEPEAEPESEPEPQPEPEPVQQLALPQGLAEEEADGVDVSMEPQIGTQGIDLEYLPEEEEESQVVPAAPGPSGEDTQEIPPTLSTHREDASQESNQTSTSVDSTEQQKHISYMNLLNAKSEEIGDLSKQLQEERSQKEELANRVAALEEQLRLAHTVATETHKALIGDLTQQLAASHIRIDEFNKTFATEREAWTRQQESLENQLNTTRGQNDHVMTMFREENGRADRMLKEKKELRKELEIAQKQVREAVGIQKAFYEKRIEKLSSRRDEAVAMSAMLVKRNARTEDDHRMRQLANEAPELRGLLRKAKDKNRDLKSRLQKVKNDNAELKMQLDEQWREPGSGSDRDGSGSPERSRHGRASSSQADLPDEDDEGDTHVHDSVPDDGNDDGDDSEDDPEDEVVRCTWRKEDNKMCNALFKTQEKLEAHVFDAGHLPPPSSPLDGLD